MSNQYGIHRWSGGCEPEWGKGIEKKAQRLQGRVRVRQATPEERKRYGINGQSKASG